MELNSATSFLGFDWEPLIRIGSAALAGLVLGIDREISAHSPGIRTHGLLCFGAALLTVSTIALFGQLGTVENGLDPLRVVEGTATVAGMLAAAMVIFRRGRTKNITTAVHLWVTVVIGLAFGAGQYPLAVAGTLLAFILLTLVEPIEARLFGRDADGRK